MVAVRRLCDHGSCRQREVPRRGVKVAKGDVLTVHYDNYTEGRAHLKDLLDAAERGRPATVRRDMSTSAIVDAERLRDFLTTVCPTKAEVVAEAGGWSIFVPGLPVAVDARTFRDAVHEMVDALREYADDWQDRLADVVNHAGHWGLVQLIVLSTDEQLGDWLVGGTS